MRTDNCRLLHWGALLGLIAAHVVGLVAVEEQARVPQPGVSLSPAVVMLSGRPGQAHRQTLRLTNHTSRELTFTLVAQDVVVEDGKRVFLDVGVRSDSVAATALFSPSEVTIPPHAVGTSEVTLTIPSSTAVRGIAAIFRGRTVVGSTSGVAMIASLGCLITFTLSTDVRLEASNPDVSLQTQTTPLSVSEVVSNVGAEPVVAKGMMALLNDAGVLVGKVALEPHRLMPGERMRIRADYPALLNPGRYRAVLSFEYENQVLTNAVDVMVPAVRADERAADRDADVRR